MDMRMGAGSARAGRCGRVVAALTASLLMSGCAMLDLGDALPQLASDTSTDKPSKDHAPKNDLQTATEYWGKEYAKNPGDLKTALSYAKNLKALGEKPRAFAVLQQASMTSGSDRELASEYGRLALEMDQVSLAGQLLEMADDPVEPDWRVISARGTVLAKQQRYADAITFYERAQSLAPEHASIMNNLALAYTMNGDAEKAEGLLRQVVAAGDANPKVRQNLALVLNLQGKYDEATRIASADLSAEGAKANTDMVRQIVKLEPKSSPAPIPAATTAVASAAPALKPTASTDDDKAVAPWDATIAVSSNTPVFQPNR